MSKNDYGRNSPNGSNRQPGGQTPDAAAPNPAPNGDAPESMRFVAPTHTGVDILKLLVELEEQVENTPRMMGALLRFDEDRFHMTLMKIRANLPEEMKRAARLMRDIEKETAEAKEKAESMLADARKSSRAEVERAQVDIARQKQAAQADVEREKEALQRQIQLQSQESAAAAESVISEAEATARRIISDTEIVRAAEMTSRDIRSRAEAEAVAIKNGANDYAASVLSSLHQTLEKAAAEVDRGREILERRG